MGWGGEAGVGAAESVGKVDVEGRLRGLGRDFFGSLALVEETEELLPLLLVFAIQMDGFRVGVVSVHRIASANDVNLSKGQERQNGVNQGRNGGKHEGRDGGRIPMRGGRGANVEVISDVHETIDACRQARSTHYELATGLSFPLQMAVQEKDV